MLPEPTFRVRFFWHWAVVAFFVVTLFEPVSAQAVPQQWQPIPAKPYVLRGSDRRLLDRAERFIADEEWDDGITALMRLLESNNPSVVAIGGGRFVSLRDYCHRLLSDMPSEARASYRSLVDTTAGSWYREGIQQRDTQILQQIVDRYFLSSWGDDALIAIGELALQRGDYQAARNAWQVLAAASSISDDLLRYPDSDLQPADVDARLVLLAIREGNSSLAESSLRQFQTEYPNAQGHLSGRQVSLTKQLQLLMGKSRKWPTPNRSQEWTTFLAHDARASARVRQADPGRYELLWTRELQNNNQSLCPIVAGGTVFFQDDFAVHALKIIDGQEDFVARGKLFESEVSSASALGQAKHTLVVANQRLYGVTSGPSGIRRNVEGTAKASKLWALDLRRGGAVAWEQDAGDPEAVFAGAPIVVGELVYVSIRSNAEVARAGIVCYDQSTSEQRWLRWFCQSNTPATGWSSDRTSSLLAYDSGVLYFNTNLGAIAAVRAYDGDVVWLRTYQRLSKLDSVNVDAYYRGPHPCVYHRGSVYFLPTDSNAVYALDAGTGEIRWRVPIHSRAATLVGIEDSRLLLNDGGHWTVDLETGGRAAGPQYAGFDSKSSVNSEPLSEPYNGSIAVAGRYVIAAEETSLSAFYDRETTDDNDE